METETKALVFKNGGRELVGIVHPSSSQNQRGILMVTGGPQYRVGSHRQFVVIARTLRDQGHSVMRFDYQGMGDSEGKLGNFLDCTDDIRAAIECFRDESGVTEVVLWGLCDGASASLMYVANGGNVAGLVLINPWVRSDASLAQTYIRYYYLRRLFSLDFFRRIFTGHINLVRAFTDFLQNLSAARGRGHESESDITKNGSQAQFTDVDFREEMHAGMNSFDGPVMLILCGEDLTAREFVNHTNEDSRWRKLLHRKSVTQRNLEGADHTFSRKVWRDQIAGWTSEWMASW